MEVYHIADKIGELREALYRSAKANPERKFYSLFDKICRKDTLEEEWQRVRTNNGAPGIDNTTTIEEFQENRTENIDSIINDLRENRSAHDAIDGIVKYLNFGCEYMIDADITSCFDNIPVVCGLQG